MPSTGKPGPAPRNVRAGRKFKNNNKREGGHPRFSVLVVMVFKRRLGVPPLAWGDAMVHGGKRRRRREGIFPGHNLRRVVDPCEEFWEQGEFGELRPTFHLVRLFLKGAASLFPFKGCFSRLFLS